MICVLLNQLALSDEEIRDLNLRLRQRLGYFDIPERELREPGPLAKWLESLFDSWERGRLENWLFQEKGWIILAIFLTGILLFVLFRFLRKIRLKRSSNDDKSIEQTEQDDNNLLSENLTRQQWKSKLDSALDQQNYSAAVVSLYRLSLISCLEQLDSIGEFSNREIALQLSDPWKNYFVRLYKCSDGVIFGDRHINEEQFKPIYQLYQSMAP